MKKYFNFFLILFIAVIFLTACGKDNEVVSDGQLVTLCDLKGNINKYKGKYVRIDNVQFISTDIGKFFGGSYVGSNLTNPNGVATRVLQDCFGNTFTIYTDVLSSFVGAIVPSGNGTFRGVISTSPTGEAQLNITKERDFSSMTNPRCNIVPTVCPTTLETIANIRKLGVNSDPIGALRIRGVVISDWSANNVTGASTQRQNFVVQDATGGITFRLSAATAAGNPFPYLMGETVEINLLGKLVAQFNDQMQIANLSPTDITDLGVVDPMPTPQVITIAQLNSDAFESQLVQINGVTFETVTPFTYSGNKNFSVGTSTAVCRTNTSATFSSTALPTGAVNIKGIAARNGLSRQIQPRNPSDLP
ncbi:MAG: hypothetical protein EAZ85_07205 [Bacteroidetes bacterium]|nr:MAG: hypothetical protein EAZ85_07205 [Bacteroidota bacterium]TAG87254.1 MAG: hypothetical protein EAZ20_10955 [Bacteroidota bacterium]